MVILIPLTERGRIYILYPLTIIMALRTSVFLFLLMMGITCQSPSDNTSSPREADMITFTDDLGRTVTVPAPISRIIPLAPSITEVLYAAGAGPQVIAVSHADDYPAAIETLPRYGSLPMDFEALVSLQPDLLIATDALNNPRDVHLFEALDLPIAYFSFNTWSDVPRVIRKLGILTGHEAASSTKADSLEAKAAALKNQLSTVQNGPSLLFLIGDDALFAFGKGSYIHEIIQMSGGTSITEAIETKAPVLSEEFVLSAQPEIIAGTFGHDHKLLEHHPTFEALPAIQNSRVCAIAPSLVLRPGPRLIEGAITLAHCIHPDLVPAENNSPAEDS